MSTVWVVTQGVDSEGAWVVGVAATEEAGLALADADATKPMQWSWGPAHPVDCWFARHPNGGVTYYEVAPWELAVVVPSPFDEEKP